MSELLDDRNNLLLLESLVSGEAVSVNFSALSKILNKHRNTIKKKVDAIFERKIIDRPLCPFFGLYKIYPLLVVVHLNLPTDERFVK